MTVTDRPILFGVCYFTRESLIVLKTLVLQLEVQRYNPVESEMTNSDEVTIVDIRMPFVSMVVFMVKATLAAIPAMIILAIIFATFASIFGGNF